MLHISLLRFSNLFPAVLITGGFASGKSGSSAEIYIPSNSSSCVLPRLPVFRKHSGIISRHSFFTLKYSDLITRLTEAWHVVTRVVTCGILRLGHGAWATHSPGHQDTSTPPGPRGQSQAPMSWGEPTVQSLCSLQTLTAQWIPKWPTSLDMTPCKSNQKSPRLVVDRVEPKVWWY